MQLSLTSSEKALRLRNSQSARTAPAQEKSCACDPTLLTAKCAVRQAKKCWGGAMGKRLAVKLRQWLAFLQIRSAFATVALTAGAANTFLHSFLNFGR